MNLNSVKVTISTRKPLQVQTPSFKWFSFINLLIANLEPGPGGMRNAFCISTRTELFEFGRYVLVDFAGGAPDSPDTINGIVT